MNDSEIESAFEELENIMNDEYVRDKVSVLKNAVYERLAASNNCFNLTPSVQVKQMLVGRSAAFR